VFAVVISGFAGEICFPNTVCHIRYYRCLYSLWQHQIKTPV
jgi:hypothetical protein